MSAAELKAQGNAAFSAKDYSKAIELFTKAIEVDSQNHVLYSNRSACYSSLKDYSAALADADKCVSMKPDWAKGYSRKGAALHGAGDLQGACDAYEKGLEVEPGNAACKSGMDSVDAQMRREMQSGNFGGSQDPFAGMAAKLNDPAFIQQMAANPKTARLLADKEFMQKLQKVKANPSSLMQEMQDPRMMSILGLLIGADISNEAPSGSDYSGGEAKDEEMPDAPTTEAPKRAESKPEPKPEPEPIEEEPSEKQQADAEKQKGNAAYKSRDFPTAIKHYQAAYELHKDITYLTNLAAAYFESKDYDAAIKSCEEAIEQGREVRADFKIIAKAFARIGSAYEKKGESALAITNYQKSLTEHRTPDTLAKLKAAEKVAAEQEKQAYINPEKADEAREAGNVAFKSADFPKAVRDYTEMTKRAPTDPRGYANRAAAYIKLMSMPEAIKDCDTAISLDSTFVKAYIRKAAALFAMKEYSKATDVCAQASQADKESKHTSEIQQQLYKIESAQYEQRSHETEQETMARIQNDPEIMSILNDGVMQSILSQCRDNPGALANHMKNPAIASKIQKLMNAGVIKTASR